MKSTSLHIANFAIASQARCGCACAHMGQTDSMHGKDHQHSYLCDRSLSNSNICGSNECDSV